MLGGGLLVDFVGELGGVVGEGGFGEESLEGVADVGGGGLGGVDLESGALLGEFVGEDGLVPVVVEGELGYGVSGGGGEGGGAGVVDDGGAGGYEGVPGYVGGESDVGGGGVRGWFVGVWRWWR